MSGAVLLAEFELYFEPPPLGHPHHLSCAQRHVCERIRFFVHFPPIHAQREHSGRLPQVARQPDKISTGLVHLHYVLQVGPGSCGFKLQYLLAISPLSRDLLRGAVGLNSLIGPNQDAAVRRHRRKGQDGGEKRLELISRQVIVAATVAAVVMFGLGSSFSVVADGQELVSPTRGGRSGTESATTPPPAWRWILPSRTIAALAAR
jgi:hypothetical protein